MVNGKVLLAFAAAMLIALSGCIITKSESECAPDLDAAGNVESASRGNPAICYHEVAVSYAMMNNAEKAIEMCEKIWDQRWISPVSRSEMNNCFSDIAIIMKNQTICNMINTGFVEDINEFFGVWQSYYDQCYEKAAPVPPETAFDFCRGAAVPLVLPLVALLAAAYRKG